MAAPANSPIALDISGFNRGSSDTNSLLGAMLRAHEHVSDLIFSPGRLPQVEAMGQLLTVQAPGMAPFTADDTRRIAADLIGNNKQAITTLREQGSCDVSYALPGVARFRVNVFIQRGSCAVVMRVIPTTVPTLSSLGLPAHLASVAELREGIVLVTGSRGSGKSSTLAALLDCINQRRTCHIITIEDPIEFLHMHKRATVHQRELHSDTPDFIQAMRAALRQAPNVIFVSELGTPEVMEMALEAAETGHLVLSSLNAGDAASTVARIASAFPAAEQRAIRTRLIKAFRCIISQRLLPHRNGSGRVAVLEILKSHPRALHCLECDDRAAVVDLIRESAAEGMQLFEEEIQKLVQAGVVDPEVAAVYANNG